MERYEKRGSALRLEFVRGDWFTMHVTERGIATSSSGSFKSESLPESHDSHEVREQLEDIRRVISSHAVERASFTIGSAAHLIDDHAGTRQWETSDAISIVTLSTLPGNGMTATLLPARACSWIEATGPIIARRNLPTGFLREPVLFDPVASAQLWAFALSSGARFSGLVLEQRARNIEDRDGTGVPIDESRGAIVRRPNLFRPSYRFPGSREPMHVRANATGKRVDTIARIFSLDDFSVEADRFTARAALSSANEAGVRRVIIHPDSIRWISDEQEWFPIRGGVWGGEVVIDVSAEPSRRLS